MPSSSYRLGVKAANLHDLFPAHITEALQHSVLMFNKEVGSPYFSILSIHVRKCTSKELYLVLNLELTVTRICLQEWPPSWSRGTSRIPLLSLPTNSKPNMASLIL